MAVVSTGDVGTLAAILSAKCSTVEHVGQVTSTLVQVARRLSSLIFALSSRPPSQLVEMWGLLTPCPPVHAAAYLGNLGALELLVAHHADVNSTQTSKGMSPLHFAAMCGHEAVTSRLLDAGALAATRDRKYNRTAAKWAERRGHDALAARLRDAEDVTITALRTTPSQAQLFDGPDAAMSC
jgi:ankyrin repeat protein